MAHVLIIGDHPYAGRMGQVVGDTVRLAGKDMRQVDLDSEGICGTNSCYCEAHQLIPAASDYREAV